jgi:hypothetical protein
MAQQPNEDRFGIIIDPKHQFKTLESANNYVDGLEEKLNNRTDADKMDYISATKPERMAYLSYGLSLMTKKNLPFSNSDIIARNRATLELLSRGYTKAAIWKWLKTNGFPTIKLDDVTKAEKEGMEMVKQCIDKVRGSQMPIFNT